MAPDYKHEIFFFRDDKDSGDYYLGVRVPGAEKPSFSRPASGWPDFSAVTSRYNFKCLWSPDAKLVAIHTRGTKRSGDTSLYAASEDKVQEIVFPDIMPRLRPHLTAELRAIFVRPELWLPNHQLLLSVEGTQMDEEHGVFRFILALQFNQSRTGQFTASIASFRQDQSIAFSVR